MPSKTKFTFASKPATTKQFTKTPSKAPAKPHHSGKGTNARLNTAAEKMMFKSKYSK